jgi:hypothetical protein
MSRLSRRLTRRTAVLTTTAAMLLMAGLEFTPAALASSVIPTGASASSRIPNSASALSYEISTIGGVRRIPASASGCQLEVLPSVRVCASVVGTGSTIKSLSGWMTDAEINVSSMSVHIELYGPSASGGTVVIKNCPQVTLKWEQTTPTCTWYGQSGVNYITGNYCARAWANPYNGNYEDVGDKCIHVN